jgi:hypothetical protein
MLLFVAATAIFGEQLCQRRAAFLFKVEATLEA